ncbi:hypothetical protein ACHABX_06465 [Nesterenkonia halotolerans]|uniref:hypothetical protein n=1 Tax=Nesterenkonia halotolerans TaxID=225325 RepID=UPI003EE60CA5
MMKGISISQMVVIVGCLIALVGSSVLVILEEWRAAALSALASFGLLAVFVVFTLAAMTHSATIARRRLLEVSRSAHQLVTSTRRVDRRTAERFKVLDVHQDKLEGIERRLLAVMEAQRFQFEDDLESLNQKVGNSSK